MKLLQKRLQVAGGLVIAGLLVELASLPFVRPQAFLIFIFVSAPLIAIGVALYLWGLVRLHGREQEAAGTEEASVAAPRR